MAQSKTVVFATHVQIEQKVALNRLIERLNDSQRATFELLTQEYAMDKWEHVCSESEFLGNLCFLELLSKHVGTPRLNSPALDIGSRNFWYAPALHSFYPHGWTGVEVDAHQRYLTGHTRKAYAEYMIAPLPQVTYQAGCLTEVTGSFGLITWFLPYILPEPMEASGLPDRFFHPDSLFDHAWRLLAPGGSLFIINQEREEAQQQELLLQHKGLTYKALGLMESVFSTYKKERFGFLVEKRT